MDMRRLGRTNLEVSALCLGSMTWGTQNSEAEGHAQIDRALATGINFIDTAEMYPVNPISRETSGRTEEIIGTWLEKSGRRDDVVVATKVSGSGNKAVRDGAPISAATIRAAVDHSLQKLRTDYIDLYQLHWPNRGSYMFRQNWTYDPTGQNRAKTLDHMAEVLGELDAQIKRGKIRHIGLSNESAWGTAMWLRVAEENNLPRMATIQNEYSLLCRMFDTDLAELCHNEDVSLLSFSPLATGLLTGKYSGDVTPKGSRRTYGETLGGRITPRVFPAVEAYQAIADRHGLDLSQMALAWAMTRPFMGSVIFGATSLAQLETSIGAADLTISDEVMAEITAANRAHPMPY